MAHYDAIVIGVGCMGSAALFHLARRGLSVLGIEQFTVAHDRGSSHGQTRIIRKAYFEHPAYIPLLHRTYDLWAELEEATGVSLVCRSGLLLVGPPNGPILTNVRRCAEEHRLAIDRVSPDDLRRRFPGFSVDDGMEGLYEADAGFLRAEACLEVHVQQAIAQGAVVATGQTVRDWAIDGNGVAVITDARRYTADHLVLCGGAWSGSLLKGLGVPLEIRRKVVLWFDTADETYHLDRGCPVFGFETDEGFFYGFPRIEEAGVKIGDHTGGEVTPSADGLDREVSFKDEQRIRRFAGAHLPAVRPVITKRSVCMYTMTPDEHFVIDRHPDHAQVLLAAGFSGHGFKFAPIVGSILADFVVNGRTDEPIEFLSVSRPALGL